RRRLRPRARLAADSALLAQVLQDPLEQRDPPAGEPAVGFQLALPGAARPDPSAEALEVLPQPAHARQVVLELSELDLELALGADGVLGEDVEDQLRPVDDPNREPVFEASLLGRRQLVVDQQGLGARLAEGALELRDLSLADVRPLVRSRPFLDDLADRLDARRARELAELPQLLARIDAGPQHGDDKSPLRLRARRGIRLVLFHD